MNWVVQSTARAISKIIVFTMVFYHFNCDIAKVHNTSLASSLYKTTMSRNNKFLLYAFSVENRLFINNIKAMKEPSLCCKFLINTSVSLCTPWNHRKKMSTISKNNRTASNQRCGFSVLLINSVLLDYLTNHYVCKRAIFGLFVKFWYVFCNQIFLQ